MCVLGEVSPIFDALSTMKNISLWHSLLAMYLKYNNIIITYLHEVFCQIPITKQTNFKIHNSSVE